MGTKLPTRQLGTTDMNITRVGFGAWATGGGGWSFGWGPQDDNESIAAMTRAVELGVNWIDTAAIYGLGHSEEVVGRALRKFSPGDRPLVFTKCGLVWDPADRMKEPVRSLNPDSIRKECEAIRHVDSLQPPFSLIRRDAAATEIPWCRANGTGVICYSPMQSGILTESFSIERVKKMAADDWRQKSANFQTPKLERNIALRDVLIPIARRYNTTASAVAIAWTLMWPGVTAAIVGARSAEQVDGWIGAATLTLTATDLDEIALAIERTRAGTGPTRPSVLAEAKKASESTATFESRV